MDTANAFINWGNQAGEEREKWWMILTWLLVVGVEGRGPAHCLLLLLDDEGRVVVGGELDQGRVPARCTPPLRYRFRQGAWVGGGRGGGEGGEGRGGEVGADREGVGVAGDLIQY